MIQRLATGGILNRPRPENPGGSVAGYAGAVLMASIQQTQTLDHSEPCWCSTIRFAK
jgi:hypothetical protein